VHEGEGWRATPELTEITIPDTLQGVLLARIDRLQEDVRRTLQLASVIGKSFPYHLLEAITEAEQQLDEHLAQLQRVDLVREKNRLPELEYIFKHSLTQEAAYNSLLVDSRREFHHRVGEALEQLFAERKEQALGLLAHHFEMAGEYARAVDYLIQAGDQARLTDEHSEAIGYYQRAIAHLTQSGDQGRAARVWLKLGLIYNVNFQFEAAHQANETAFRVQQAAMIHLPPTQNVKRFPYRIYLSASNVTLDPGKSYWAQDIHPIGMLFSGLARLDPELNVVPEVARSWRVLDEGRRYLFHLRDDWFWTDGVQVTAHDFEWAWKRNLNPDFLSITAQFLYDVVGAQDYNQGNNTDPDNVGVRALDAHTLEVRLVEPVAYFPFIITMPVTFPLPATVIQSFGEDWWSAEHIVSNGSFRLVGFDKQHGGDLERNPAYPGVFEGNIQRLEWRVSPDRVEMLKAYRDNRADFAYFNNRSDILDSVPQEEIYSIQELTANYMVLNPTLPPFDDPRVRMALGLSLDRQKLSDLFNYPALRGGLVPPGMPGHSPQIGHPFDVERAHKLLAEAGYPGGQGFPVIKGLAPSGRIDQFDHITSQWRTNLGIEIIFKGVDSGEFIKWDQRNTTSHFEIDAWLADYPDPDNFLRRSTVITKLHYMGWQDAEFDKLVEEAARTPDRAKRMAMYRQADRRLVEEQALVLPLFYNMDVELVKPWVKKPRNNLLGYVQFQKIIIGEY
jgi:oligopeptide transport system substrate-binding protein